MYFDLESRADSIVIRVYNKGMIALWQESLPGPFAVGWNQVPLEMPGLDNGLYYLVVVAKEGERESEGNKPTRVFILR